MYCILFKYGHGTQIWMLKAGTFPSAKAARKQIDKIKPYDTTKTEYAVGLINIEPVVE